MRLQNRIIVLAFLAWLALSATVQAATHVVRVGNYWFSPTNIAVALGDSVRWTNVSMTAHDTTHTPTSGARLWEAALNVASQKTYTFVFTNPGYYPYACVQHANLLQTGAVFAVAARISAVVRLADGRTQLTISNGRQGLGAVTETSTNMIAWMPVSTNGFPISGNLTITDPSSVNRPVSFYRARLFAP